MQNKKVDIKVWEEKKDWSNITYLSAWIWAPTWQETI